MTCPVCGDPDPGAACPRCGTDLRALQGGEGQARLQVVPVAPTKSPRGGRPERQAGQE